MAAALAGQALPNVDVEGEQLTAMQVPDDAREVDAAYLPTHRA